MTGALGPGRLQRKRHNANLDKMECKFPWHVGIWRARPFIQRMPPAAPGSPSSRPDPSSLLAQIDAIESLPVLSEHHLLLRAVVEDREATLEETVSVIEGDPAFTANLLHLANSPLYGQRSPVRTIASAVRVLGLQGVADLSLTLEVVRGFGFPAGMDMQLFWDHSVNVALLAKQLAPVERADPELAYLAGLLHDVGTLALVRFLPETFATLLSETQDGRTIHEACSERFGCQPLDITVRLLSDWRLSPLLARALGLLASDTWRAGDEAQPIRAAVFKAHKTCEHHGGGFTWDRLPDVADEAGVPVRAHGFIPGLSASILTCCH